MYWRLARLRRFSVSSGRSSTGRVDTCYFDPEDWAIRFIAVVRATDGGESTTMLVSPLSFSHVAVGKERIELIDDWRGTPVRGLPTFLSPRETGRAVRQCRLPSFWCGSGVWGDYRTPSPLRRDAAHGRTVAVAGQPPPALYPHTVPLGREVFCIDGRLGVVSDLLIDINAWRIRYFIVWVMAPGERGEALLSPFWVNGPPQKTRITAPMTTGTIVRGPTFVPEELEPLDEQILAHYYGFLRD
jgi:hypothetical protein